MANNADSGGAKIVNVIPPLILQTTVPLHDRGPKDFWDFIRRIPDEFLETFSDQHRVKLEGWGMLYSFIYIKCESLIEFLYFYRYVVSHVHLVLYQRFSGARIRCANRFLSSSSPQAVAHLPTPSPYLSNAHHNHLRVDYR